MFESDVIPDSGKTFPALCAAESTFESDVIPDSGKTPHGYQEAVIEV